jgi:hypothetical protein
MDLALDNLALEDRNYKRFALILTDNAIELTLHRIAEDKNSENKQWEPLGKIKYDQKLVSAALGQHFEAKVKLAIALELIPKETGQTITILHSYRNQAYHQGIQHEEIISSLSLFYFQVVCQVLSEYKPSWFSWSSNQEIPYRARKYLGNNLWKSSQKACASAFSRLREVSEGFSLELVEDLSEHMGQVINDTDEMIDFLSSDSPEPKNRNAVVIDCQAWPFAFTDEGKAFARDNNSPAKTVFEHVEWITENYQWPTRKDPVPSWKKRLASLKKEVDNHKALKKYNDFMSQTSDIRSRINEAAIQLDQHIQQQIDMARGK